VGANGTGKTTLLKCLRNELQPLRGKAKLGASLNIGYYDQMHTGLDENINVYDTMQYLMPGADTGEVLSWLARFSFAGDDVTKLVKVLSGGEKARLYLASLIRKQPNFLILDEPTNHLDINTIEELEIALESYEGTVIFVSHDSYFIRKTANRILFIKDKAIKEVDADIEDIFNESLSIQKVKKNKNCVDGKSNNKRVNPQILADMIKAIEKIQKGIIAIDDETANIEAKYAQEEFYSNHDKLENLKRQHLEFEMQKKHLEFELEKRETEYLERCEE